MVRAVAVKASATVSSIMEGTALVCADWHGNDSESGSEDGGGNGNGVLLLLLVTTFAATSAIYGTIAVTGSFVLAVLDYRQELCAVTALMQSITMAAGFARAVRSVQWSQADIVRHRRGAPHRMAGVFD